MAEQLLHRGGVELVDALKVFGMDAARHEQAIDSKTMSAGEVGPYRIPDRKHAAEFGCMPVTLGGKLHGAFVDLPVRLSLQDHFASKLAIEFGDHARAINKPGPAFDDDAGVRAGQLQLASSFLHHH